MPRLPRALGWPSWLRTCSRSYTKGAGRLVWRLRAANPNLLLQDSGFQGPRAVLGPRPTWCMTGGHSRLVAALFAPFSIQSCARTDFSKCPLFYPCVSSPPAKDRPTCFYSDHIHMPLTTYRPPRRTEHTRLTRSDHSGPTPAVAWRRGRQSTGQQARYGPTREPGALNAPGSSRWA